MKRSVIRDNLIYFQIKMVNYRRAKIAGSTYYFTLTLRDRKSDLFVKHVDLLREAMKNVHERQLFTINAIVIMPEHLHTIWTLPDGDIDYSGRWRSIKSQFTRSVLKAGETLVKNKRGEYELWQRRFWEHLIRDERDLQAHVDYIHFNPVKHGYVNQPVDWEWSSIHRFIRDGLIDANWAVEADDGGKFGE
jgi:putative transposase